MQWLVGAASAASLFLFVSVRCACWPERSAGVTECCWSLCCCVLCRASVRSALGGFGVCLLPASRALQARSVSLQWWQRRAAAAALALGLVCFSELPSVAAFLLSSALSGCSLLLACSAQLCLAARSCLLALALLLLLDWPLASLCSLQVDGLPQLAPLTVWTL